jgi:hypothetical protein
MTGSRQDLARRSLPILLSCALAASACGARLMKLPSGPGAPASDIQQIVDEAIGACRTAAAVTAEVAVSGSVSGRRLRARLLVGLAAPASGRVEAFAFNQQIFILVAQGGEATLLMTRDNRVLQRGRPREIVEAMAGVPLDVDDLRATLLGCDAVPALPLGRQLGAEWRVVSNGPRELYFRRAATPVRWRLVAAVHHDPGRPDWRAEYSDFDGNLPSTIRLIESGGRFNLRLALSQVELNAPLPAAAFTVNVPASADPMTIEELRRSGLLPGE